MAALLNRWLSVDVVAPQFRMVYGSGAAQPAHDGTVELFHCPHCGKGFMEVTAHFKARWRGPDRGKKKESWLVASQELPAGEMERFAALLEFQQPQ